MNIWVNGCFDILHVGHLDLLEYAKNLRADWYTEKGEKNILIVGIDSDARVKQLKGENRPINCAVDRFKMLKALNCVDEVVVFDSEDELRKLIRYYNIDFIVVGEEYRNRVVIGGEYSKYGIKYNPIIASTTSIIEKIKKNAQIEVFNEILDEVRDNEDTISMNFHNYALSKLKNIK